MQRRNFLKTASLGAIATSSLAMPAIASSDKQLTMVTSWGRGLAGVHDAAQRFVDKVNEMDMGVSIELKAAGELVGAFDVFDAVESGQADLWHAAPYYFTGKHMAFGFFTSVPFGMTAEEYNIWFYNMGGRELADELFGEFDQVTMPAGNTGLQGGGWFRKEINAPEDFRGLKFRMPGLGGKVLSGMGASVINLPGSEVYQSLATGALDGTEWIGPWADEKAGFQEITKIYYTSGMHEPGASLTTTFNRYVWEDLSNAQRAMIESAAAEANAWNLGQFQSNNGAALQRLIDGGVLTLNFSDDVWTAMANAAAQMYAENMNDAMFKKIHDHYFSSMKQLSHWLSLSQGQYITQRNRVQNAGLVG